VRIAIVAPGAVGGYFGGLLAKAGEDVVALARGAHLAAIREHGLRIEGPDGGATVRLEADDDAARLGVADGELVRVSSRAGSVEIAAEVTADIMPGVVSIPHGWGHDVDGIRMTVAAAHPGVNSNLLSDETLLDVPSGTAVLNGIPVELGPS